MRWDDGLAELLRYENVAWYEDGQVRILDRRVYPRELRFEICKTHVEVRDAIRNMVTQSAGPYTACGMAMALAAYEARNLCKNEKKEFLKRAAFTISHARPTTVARMEKVARACLEVGLRAIDEGKDAIQAIFNRTLNSLENRYRTMQKVGDNLASLMDQNSIIMTQCYGETIVGTMLRAARQRGLSPKFIIPETRPYLQGARLTASVISDMGFDHILISDNMAAWAMDYYGVNIFTSAADTITREGYVINKVGTLGLAILAKNFSIPYYVTGILDDKTIDGVKIEFRNQEEVKCHAGILMTKKEIKAVYPAFDITGPDFVSAYVTEIGVLQKEDFKNYNYGIEFY